MPTMAFLLILSMAGPMNEPLRAELIEMKQEDQAAMSVDPPNLEQVRAVVARNTTRLKEIVEEHGWPHAAVVGEDGAFAAWLIAQHSDADREFQHQVLGIMEPLVEEGYVSRQNYAYLWDRVNEPQRFGTQGGCVGPGEWKPREIEDVESVNERRAWAGLPPLQDYVAGISERACR